MSKEISKKEDGELKLNPQGYVTLPFGEEHFKAFVVGLLGKPQRIDNILEGSFSLEMSDIKNIYLLLNQRIKQQNDAQLIQFTARVFFSDYSSVLVNSIEDLMTYNEIRPVICTEVHLSFQYLIKFVDKSVQEKQEINISFVSSGEYLRSSSRLKFIDAISPYRIAERLRATSRNGFIQYSIKHTARTWGSDIDNLLSNHLSSLIQHESLFRQRIRNNIAILNFFTFFGTIGLGGYFSTFVYKNVVASNSILLNEKFKSAPQNLELLSNEIKYIALNNLQDPYGKALLSIFISLTIASASIILIDRFSSKQKESFILITNETKKYKIQREIEYDRNWIKLLLSIIGGILIGVASNYVFYYLTK